jgi:organic radical activating enzyme
MVRKRVFSDSNYAALFSPSGKTVHWRICDSNDYTELQYPELYDVAINSLCAGRCQYCYISSTPRGKNYDNVVGKATQYFGSMSMNERPFQIAIGGAGEPTMHPDFPEFMKTIRGLGIMPNYTTNGMHLSNTVLDATEEYAGGVAVTTHAHLEKYWRVAIKKLCGITKLNLHFIPMSINDVDTMLNIANEYRDVVEYFVVLPYQAIGFGEPIDMEPVYTYMFDRLHEVDNLNQFAYGAYFYNQLKKRDWINADLYEHGLFSKYLDMDGNMTLFKSSYDWQTPLLEGLLA